MWSCFLLYFIKEGTLRRISASHRIQGQQRDHVRDQNQSMPGHQEPSRRLSGVSVLLCIISAKPTCEPLHQPERGPSQLTQLHVPLTLTSHQQP